MTVVAGRVALSIIYEGLFVDGLLDNDKKWRLKNIPNSKMAPDSRT